MTKTRSTTRAPSLNTSVPPVSARGSDTPRPSVQPPRPRRAPTSARRTAPLPSALCWTALASLRTRVGGPAPQARACGLPTRSAPRLSAAGSEHARLRSAAAKSGACASQTAVPALRGGGSPKEMGTLSVWRKAKSWTTRTPMAAHGSRLWSGHTWT